jgi:hypothetical protein
MGGLFIVTVEASPASEQGGAVGAYINVFTTVATELEALAVARREVADAGWHFGNVDNVAWVTRDDYAEDSAGLEYFEQALMDGTVVVVHSFTDILH